MTGFETTLLLAFLGVVAIAYWALRRSILVTAWLRIKWRHYLTALNAAQDLDLQVSDLVYESQFKRDYQKEIADCLSIIDDADADIAMLHTNITEMWLEYQAMQMERNGAYKDLARLDADYESLGDEFTAYRLAHPVTHRRDSLGRFAKVEFEETPEPDAEAKAEPAPNIEPAEVASEKPLLADAQVGDLCQRRDGKWVQIYGIPPETLYWEAGNQLYYPEGNLSLDREDEKDVIATEPLAPEGSAEWAWQMMLLGNLIIHSEYSGKHHTWSMDKKGIACASHSGMFANCKEQWLRNAIGNGWQLYTPEAKQDLTNAPFEGLDGVKVGDPVLFSDGLVRDVTELYGIPEKDRFHVAVDTVKYCAVYNLSDGKEWMMRNANCIRAIRIATPLDLKLYGGLE